MKKQITAILMGAGDRGLRRYAPYALQHPDEIKFVAIAEPNKERREAFRQAHGLPEERCYESWQDLLDQPNLAEAALICTQDQMHYEPTMRALEKGYHVLLEKPMSPNPSECIRMADFADRQNRVLVICHVLRYTPFFSTLKHLVDSGRIGQLVSIQHNENVGFWHQAHSFVRGNWRNSKESSPMILAKCCHDMDILYWLADSECKSISSFGELTYFKAQNAPEGAPERCLDGCPAADECPFYAPKTYLTENTEWPTAVISDDLSLEGRTRALREGPYGRCVFKCDNDVVDHQVVNIEFENKVTAAFTMCAFTNDCSRTIKLMGTKGEIRGAMEKNELEVTDFLTRTKETIRIESDGSGHGGGDFGLMRDFVRILQTGEYKNVLTSAQKSVHSHLMAFAAEASRLNRKIIDMEWFRQQW